MPSSFRPQEKFNMPKNSFQDIKPSNTPVGSSTIAQPFTDYDFRNKQAERDQSEVVNYDKYRQQADKDFAGYKPFSAGYSPEASSAYDAIQQMLSESKNGDTSKMYAPLAENQNASRSAILGELLTQMPRVSSANKYAGALSVDDTMDDMLKQYMQARQGLASQDLNNVATRNLKAYDLLTALDEAERQSKTNMYNKYWEHINNLRTADKV
jgi:hypothetical protein